MAFLNPFTKPTPDPKPADPTDTADPTSAPAPTPDPNAIPETMDLAFFNSLIKPTATKDPDKPLSVMQDILTEENLAKISKGQDFSKAIPPETLQKLQSGDQSATMDAVQHIARAAHAAALSQTGAIIDTVLQQQGSAVEQRVQKNLQDSLAMKDITSDVPGIDQPVVKAGFEMVSNNFRSRFPNASTEQIRAMAQNYFKELASAINPPSTPTVDPAKKQEDVDWLAFAGFESPNT